MKKRVEGYQNLYKDDISGVISNREDTERDKYKRAKRIALDNINTKYQLDALRSEMDEIKSLLKQLTNK